jgi:hypothetical protein
MMSAPLISNGGITMNRLLSSMVAFGVGAYAYKMADGKKMLTRRNMNKMRKRVMKNFS